MFRSNLRPLLVILAAGVSTFAADRKTVDEVRRVNAQFLKAIESGKAVRYFSPEAFQSKMTAFAGCFPGTRPEQGLRATVRFVLEKIRTSPRVAPGTNANLLIEDPNLPPANDVAVDGFAVYSVDSKSLDARRESTAREGIPDWLEEAVATPGAKVAATLSVPKGLLVYALWQKKAGGTWKIIGFSPTCD